MSDKKTVRGGKLMEVTWSTVGQVDVKEGVMDMHDGVFTAPLIPRVSIGGGTVGEGDDQRPVKISYSFSGSLVVYFPKHGDKRDRAYIVSPEDVVKLAWMKMTEDGK